MRISVITLSPILGYFGDRKESEAVIDPGPIRFEVVDWTEEQLNEAAARVTQRRVNHIDADQQDASDSPHS